jgi:uncharacterized protein YjbJ (UPF0337 family)
VRGAEFAGAIDVKDIAPTNESAAAIFIVLMSTSHGKAPNSLINSQFHFWFRHLTRVMEIEQSCGAISTWLRSKKFTFRSNFSVRLTGGIAAKPVCRRARNTLPDVALGRNSVRMEDHAMDWNRVEGNWKEVKGKVKEKWGKLTDDDLTAINGQRDQLEGRLQQRYGYAKDQTKKEVDSWFSTLK